MSLHLSPPLPAHATLHLDGLDFPQPLPLARIARLPLGWHLLAWQPAPHSSGCDGMPGAPPRRGIFFRTTAQDDETRRAWHPDAQSLRSSSSSSSDSDAEAEADSALAPAAAAAAAAAVAAVASSSSSSSAHPAAAAAVSYPLPLAAQRAWALQTRLLWRVPHVLPRVLCGASSSEQLHIDASQSLVHAELPRGQRASRAERALEAHLNDSKPERFRGTLAFTRVRLRQSWKEAVGEERSRWSEDKSLALAEALEEAGGEFVHWFACCLFVVGGGTLYE